MTKLLLILVLFGPSDKQAGDRVAAQLTELGGKSARVLAGPEAAKELEKRGVKDVDLVASPEIGEQLTRRGADLAVIRLDHRKTGGDDVVETTVWSRGHADRHVSIAGGGNDAIEGAVRGVIAIVGPQLPEPDDDGAADESRPPQLADSGSWNELLQLVAPFGPPPPHPRSVRWCYYEVLALTRLGRFDRADEAVARMRAAYPGHFLADAAASLIPPHASQPAADAKPELEPAPAVK